MLMPKVGKIPEFGENETTPGIEEEKESVGDESTVPETATPSEPPAENKPDAEVPETEVPAQPETIAPPASEEIDPREKMGIESERERLLREVAELRRLRRELRIEQKETPKPQEPLIVNKDDGLSDIDPTSVEIVQKVLQKELQKYGHVTREEMERSRYESVKQEEIEKFLNEFKEYTPENDPKNTNWDILNEHIQRFYKAPDNPRDIGQLLRLAHRNIVRAAPVKQDAAAQHRVAVAGVGSGGTQRAAPRGKFTERQRQIYRDGGWNEQEILEMERDL